MAASSKAVRRIMKELERVGKAGEELANTEAGPVSDTDMFTWKAVLRNVGEPYAGGEFELQITFPEDFPFKPPTVVFVTPVYHPNIDKSGEICMPILKADVWRPMNSVINVLTAVRDLMEEPNPSDPLRPKLAAQYLDKRAAFDKAAKKHTKTHAKPKK
ncbi:ubiquitin carrier protein [Thecamonas trahens ATCC 50062]|uniref:Ubiquitin carrier protein n=1 Tax=Thecamonas trahens ATCC 50062 TaxID=461836 RepID=A0A0L0DMR0_THETB|nr:ubiquitin carrier protein [Thecamonas trahens ATCC 50062]KNC53582.1 ubiquitin carrier protein [Thecamonas trahens ATCC 50062]|eukprot:XP_013761899.1 ubiquitin carrier protein [Thecamonas trahens ATCC 50062]